MNTQEYIDNLRSKTKQPIPAAMRQAMYYFLYKENIPVDMIAKVMNKSRRVIYMGIYKTRDLLEVKDKVQTDAYEETLQHRISIRPYTIDSGIMTRHLGYKMIIDGIIL